MLTKEAPEMLRVATIGTGGWFASLTLERVSTILSIAVSVATLAYIILKIYYVVKNRGKVAE